MPPEANNYAPLIGTSPKLQAALRDMQDAYLQSVGTVEDEFQRILGRSAVRQIEVIRGNLRAFDERGGHIFATSQNLALLEDLMSAVSALHGPARSDAEEAWTKEALALRAAIEEAAPSLGIDLRRTDFARVSLELVGVSAQNSFGQLSDFATLQQSTVVELKRGLADSMARGLDWRAISREMAQTGVEALPAIPGFRRAFSLEERGRMIGRTETVRVQTQLQAAFGEEAGLDWGRSYLNWFLKTHHELCLWAESIGWAPVSVFQAGPGLPPRHTNCGCNWQTGLKDWVEPKEGPKAMAKDFSNRLREEGIKPSAELFGRASPLVREHIEQAGLEVKPAKEKP